MVIKIKDGYSIFFFPTHTYPLDYTGKKLNIIHKKDSALKHIQLHQKSKKYSALGLITCPNLIF